MRCCHMAAPLKAAMLLEREAEVSCTLSALCRACCAFVKRQQIDADTPAPLELSHYKLHWRCHAQELQG